MSQRLCNALSITIVFRKFKSSYHGWCAWQDSNFRPREFEIEINNSKSRKAQLATLAHEMVHVKQWARGELFDYLLEEKTRWQGAVYKRDGLDYYDEPWEIEAHGRELGLVERYKRYCRKNKA